MNEWWVTGLPRRRRLGPFTGQEQAIEARQVAAAQETVRLREAARDGVLITDEQIRARLRRIRVVERAGRSRSLGV